MPDALTDAYSRSVSKTTATVDVLLEAAAPVACCRCARVRPVAGVSANAEPVCEEHATDAERAVETIAEVHDVYACNGFTVSRPAGTPWQRVRDTLDAMAPG
jgi:hypothetical protein